MDSLSKRLRLLRERSGYSVAKISTLLGVAESTYRDWEYGRQIKGEPYSKLAEILGTSLSYLMTGESPEFEEELNTISQAVSSIRSKL